jgi:hypothetical protein
MAAVLLCLSVAATAQPLDGEGTFQAAARYPAGLYPWSMAVGDFNGDGAIDLAVANLGARVSVLLGNGDGSFRAPVSYAAGYYPAFVTVGDLDGDGHDDLIVAGHYSEDICVLVGNGDGTFRAPVSHGAGSQTWSIAVGDLDRDGRADLALATGTRSGVRVMLGSGGGAFGAPASYGEGTYPASVALGDFNGDHRVDLAVAGESGGGVSVLPGNGDGTFQEASRASTTPRGSITVGDFNGDGRADLAAAGQLRAGVGVLLGNGDGTFQAEVSYGPDLLPRSVVAGDFNADGRDDLAVVNYELKGKSGLLYRGHVAVLASDDATFRPAVHYGAGSYPRALAVADLNGDGKTDLAAANSTSFDVSVLLNGPVTTTTTMHVGRIDSRAQLWLDGTWWRIGVAIRADDAGHGILPGTIVSGSWDDGSTSACVTGLVGPCVIVRSPIPAGTAAVTFTVTTLTNPTHPEYAYDASANHDPNGGSDGTSITVMKP